MGGAVYDERPWLARYAEGQPADIEPAHASALAMFAATVRRCPDSVALHYLDSALTHAEVDALSSAFAAALAERGVARGERVALS
jgi:long-chain acyl-CoA synthetase